MPKVILISGGSEGLGKSIAKRLTGENQVIILAHNRAKLEAASQEIGCDFIEGELTDFASLKSAVDQIIAKYQKIDVLVNNAGIWMEGQLDDNDPAKIKDLINVNTTGTIFLTKAVLPQMRAQGYGQIVNIVSQDGISAKKDRSVYHTSKWAITGFTKCLQEDLHGTKIKVTAINPGLMKTSLFEKSGVKRDLTNSLDTDEVANLVQFVINLKPETTIPEVGIKNILNPSTNMDDTSSPIIDLNIDPDLITPQGETPQVTPPTPTAQPANPGVIDITPQSQIKSSEPTIPASPAPVQDSGSAIAPHLTDLLPKEETAPAPTPTVTPEPPLPPVSEPTPTQVETPPQIAPVDTQPTPTPAETTPSANPLFEDPDLVKLVK